LPIDGTFQCALFQVLRADTISFSVTNRRRPEQKYLYNFSTLEYNVDHMNIDKALFFKPGAIGDLLHTLPAVNAFKRTFPSAQITIVVSPGMKPVMEGSAVADRVLIFDKTQFKKNYRDFFRFAFMLRRERFDLFVDLQPSLRSGVLRRIAGAGRTLVYRKKRLSSSGDRRMHAAENFLETLRPLGIAGDVTEIELRVSREAVQAADAFLKRHGFDGSKKLVALNCSVGAARPARNWFPERFSLLADRLVREAGAMVVFIGGPEDVELVRSVMASMQEKAIPAAGNLSIAESAALLMRCACLVSSDTGPLHLATAVHTPVIGLFGSTDPRRTGPLGRGHQVIRKDMHCVPCEEKECPEGSRACMEAITVAEIFDAVKRAI